LVPSLRLKGGLAAAKQKLPDDAPKPAKKRVAKKKKEDEAMQEVENPTAEAPEDPATAVDNEALPDAAPQERQWTVEKAGDLEVLSTRESVLKRPDMWIGDISTVVKLAYEVVYEPTGASNDTSINTDNIDVSPISFDPSSPPASPRKSAASNREDHAAPVLATPSKMAKMLAAGVNGQPTGGRLVARQREMKYNAGVLKTFDEIIVNAVDRQVEVEEMREIRVFINRETGDLGVWNDGPGIEPVLHKSGKGLIPEVAFGEFMASTNFDDDTRKRFTGGRFGVGAKATNAWSRWFRVTTKHAASGMVYNQTWTDNMLHKTSPSVVKDKSGLKGGYTEIRWLPDYKRFGLTEGLDEDTYACMVMRVYDLCACTRESIKVTLNGMALPFSTLSDYADLFWGSIKTSEGRERVHFMLGEKGSAARLEVVISTSASAHLEARGMINGVLCSQGTHIDYIVNKVSDGLVDRAIKQV
jgi:DNA gyrase/topoisomerase IV subunit B